PAATPAGVGVRTLLIYTVNSLGPSTGAWRVISVSSKSSHRPLTTRHYSEHFGHAPCLGDAASWVVGFVRVEYLAYGAQAGVREVGAEPGQHVPPLVAG